jgi:hypothetical protein
MREIALRRDDMILAQKAESAQAAQPLALEQLPPAAAE